MKSSFDMAQYISMQMEMMGNDEPLYSLSRRGKTVKEAIGEANTALEQYLKRMEENPSDYPTYDDDEIMVKVEIIRKDGFLKQKKTNNK